MDLDLTRRRFVSLCHSTSSGKFFVHNGRSASTPPAGWPARFLQLAVFSGDRPTGDAETATDIPAFLLPPGAGSTIHVGEDAHGLPTLWDGSLRVASILRADTPLAAVPTDALHLECADWADHHGESGVQALAERLAGGPLVSLDLGCVTRLSSLEVLAPLSASLRALHLFGSEGLHRLDGADWPRLELLTLTTTADVLDGLGALPSLRALALFQCKALTALDSLDASQLSWLFVLKCRRLEALVPGTACPDVVLADKGDLSPVPSFVALADRMVTRPVGPPVRVAHSSGSDSDADEAPVPAATRLRAATLARLHGRIQTVDASPAYALQHGVFHALSAGDVERAAGLLTDGALALARAAEADAGQWEAEARALATMVRDEPRLLAWADVLSRLGGVLHLGSWRARDVLAQECADQGLERLLPESPPGLLLRSSGAAIPSGLRRVLSAEGEITQILSLGEDLVVRRDKRCTHLRSALPAFGRDWELPRVWGELHPLGLDRLLWLGRQSLVLDARTGAVCLEVPAERPTSVEVRGGLAACLRSTEPNMVYVEDISTAELVLVGVDQAGVSAWRLPVPPTPAHVTRLLLPDEQTVALARDHHLLVWRRTGTGWEGPLHLRHPADVLGAHPAYPVAVEREGDRVWTWAADGGLREWSWSESEQPLWTVHHDSVGQGGFRLDSTLYVPALTAGGRLPGGRLWSWCGSRFATWSLDGEECSRQGVSGTWFAGRTGDGAHLVFVGSKWVCFQPTEGEDAACIVRSFDSRPRSCEVGADRVFLRLEDETVVWAGTGNVAAPHEAAEPLRHPTPVEGLVSHGAGVAVSWDTAGAVRVWCPERSPRTSEQRLVAALDHTGTWSPDGSLFLVSPEQAPLSRSEVRTSRLCIQVVDECGAVVDHMDCGTPRRGGLIGSMKPPLSVGACWVDERSFLRWCRGRAELVTFVELRGLPEEDDADLGSGAIEIIDQQEFDHTDPAPPLVMDDGRVLRWAGGRPGYWTPPDPYGGSADSEAAAGEVWAEPTPEAQSSRWRVAMVSRVVGNGRIHAVLQQQGDYDRSTWLQSWSPELEALAEVEISLQGTVDEVRLLALPDGVAVVPCLSQRSEGSSGAVLLWDGGSEVPQQVSPTDRQWLSAGALDDRRWWAGSARGEVWVFDGRAPGDGLQTPLHAGVVEACMEGECLWVRGSDGAVACRRGRGWTVYARPHPGPTVAACQGLPAGAGVRRWLEALLHPSNAVGTFIAGTASGNLLLRTSAGLEVRRWEAPSALEPSGKGGESRTPRGAR